MIRFELKKIWKNKIFIVFLFAFIFIDVILIYNENLTQINVNKYKDHRYSIEVYDNIKGRISLQKVEYLESISLNPDYETVDTVFLLQRINKALQYRIKAQEVVSGAETNIEFYESIGNKKEAIRNTYIADCFRGRSINDYYNYDGIDEYLKFDYSTMMVTILMVISIFPLFYRDRKSGMDRIIKTGKNGGHTIVLVKLASMIITGLCLICLLRVIEYIEFHVIYGFEALDHPLYHVPEYNATLFSESIRQFFILDLCMKCLGILIIIILLCAAACIIKYSIAPVIIIMPLFLSGGIIKLFNGYRMAKETELIYVGYEFFTDIFLTIAAAIVICIVGVMAVGRLYIK